MLIPYKPKSLPIIRAKPKYIIIHDLDCMYHDIDQVKMDAKLSQMNKARNYNWILNGKPDVNYHFVAERVGKDFETLIGRPINRMCKFDDIPNQYDTKAIHVACMGRYSIIAPTQRFYMQLAYRAIAPWLYTFGIPITNVLLHHEVSDSNDACPGPFFMKNKLISAVKAMRSQ